MQISQPDFYMLFLPKHTDLERYAYYLLSLDLSDYTLVGVFKRCINAYEGGNLKTYSVKVIRVRDKAAATERTYSLRPNFLLTGSQFSIRFLLFVAYQYYYGCNRRISDLLDRFDITQSTLYIWLKLFTENHATWFSALCAAEKLANDLKSK